MILFTLVFIFCLLRNTGGIVWLWPLISEALSKCSTDKLLLQRWMIVTGPNTAVNCARFAYSTLSTRRVNPKLQSTVKVLAGESWHSQLLWPRCLHADETVTSPLSLLRQSILGLLAECNKGRKLGGFLFKTIEGKKREENWATLSPNLSSTTPSSTQWLSIYGRCSKGINAFLTGWKQSWSSYEFYLSHAKRSRPFFYRGIMPYGVVQYLPSPQRRLREYKSTHFYGRCIGFTQVNLSL